jgi:hypothetical protein
VTALLAEQVIERLPAVRVLNRLADGLKDTAQRIAKKLWGRDTVEASGGRRMEFASDDFLRHSTGDTPESSQKGTGKTARSSDGSPQKDPQDKKSPDQKPDDSYPPRTESGRIDWVKQRLLPVEERIDRLLESGRFKADPKRLAELKSKVLEEQRSKASTGGYNGELEFIERKVYEEKKHVEMVRDNHGKTNPDYYVDGDITEVKTTVVKTDNPRTITEHIKDANKQLKLSGIVSSDKNTGSLEIQLINQGSESYRNAIELENIVRRQFHENRSRSLHRVAIYREHQLILELIRTQENKIIKSFPKG